MLDRFIKDSGTLRRLRAGPVGTQIDSFTARLATLGYARATIREQVWLLSGLSRWMERRRLSAAELDEGTLEAFAHDRQRRCRERSSHATLDHFLDHLRAEGVAPVRPVVADRSPIAVLAVQYEQHLRVERGLSATTLTNYLPVFRRFLTHTFGPGPVHLAALTASHLAGFVQEQARTMHRGRAKLMVTALRSICRFWLQHGDTQRDLAAAVPAVAHWRLATIPKYLPPDEIERLLNGCCRHTPVGRRDYAILLLLARLGLRAGEVVGLELDDFHWRAGEFTIRGKGRREDRLPLSTEIGRAVAAYLRHDRPACATRRLFLRSRAPRRRFGGPSSVTTIVNRALERAGLHPPVRGAHLLRHSLATRMLSHGASLREIGQILRHQTVSTTEIYAKVDLMGLRSLVVPWLTRGGVA
jgi:integrase/recombinase XerD